MQPLAPPPIPPAFDGNLSDEYTPENWDLDLSWSDSQTIETPVSPPHFEREGRSDSVVEYNDSESLNPAGDVDHRQLRLTTVPPSLMGTEKVRSADVDHRNLISLTGSPPIRSVGEASTATTTTTPAQATNVWKGDMVNFEDKVSRLQLTETFCVQDFRKIMQMTESLTKDGSFPSLDSDYRINHGPFSKQSSTDESSSSIKPLLSDADASKHIPGLMSPPPTSHPPPRTTPSKGNTRGNFVRHRRSIIYGC